MPPLALAPGAALVFADFLTGTCNLPAAAATAVQEQGLLTYNGCKDLTDKDVTNICDKARDPGGLIARGGRGAKAAGGGGVACEDNG